MKAIGWLALGAAALLLYETYEKAQAANDINVTLNKVSVVNLNDIQIGFAIQNVTNATITLNAITGNLFLNGNNIATFQDFVQQDIIPTGQTQVNVDVSPSWFSIASDVQALLSTTGSQLNFTATGNINLAGLPILPFSLAQTVTV